MMVSPYVFKTRALRALKGNWQTALLVSFFASLPFTAVQLFQATQLPDVSRMLSMEAAQAAVAAVPAQTWLLMGLLAGLSLVLTPVLSLGCDYYFIERLHGREPGFAGLFARMGSFFKVLLLYVLIYLKTFLWSLLLIVPGFMAAMRYSLAPLYLAEDPTLGVLEALRKSKQAMQNQKMSMFMLQLSFVVWLFAALLAEMVLSGMSPVLALVASQFIQLAMATYLNASVAGFYLAAAAPNGMQKAQEAAAMWLRTYGGSVGPRPFGNDDPPADHAPQDDAAPDDPQGGEASPDPQGDHSGDPTDGE